MITDLGKIESCTRAPVDSRVLYLYIVNFCCSKCMLAIEKFLRLELKSCSKQMLGSASVFVSPWCTTENQLFESNQSPSVLLCEACIIP
jgi:hypothetical protein